MVAIHSGGYGRPAPGCPVARHHRTLGICCHHYHEGEEMLKCENLKVGEYNRKDSKRNDVTQIPVNCIRYIAHVPCFPTPNIICKDFGDNEIHFTQNGVGFLKPMSC
ncbi:unnamed protein product [Gulo gulo]|uniref:Uncharacterized protein n=1 Tax=Gulo gulo TaxID=48420 RepID=A0A9X9PTW0_GULGU|nr:unnamed protein product [Gulo gulo]